MFHLFLQLPNCASHSENDDYGHVIVMTECVPSVSGGVGTLQSACRLKNWLGRSWKRILPRRHHKTLYDVLAHDNGGDVWIYHFVCASHPGHM
ncbi:hypothetical protein AVEN_137251-1 [Araneus ventricosus]|uniref:Uncharacterized protein n=1 Tax=Araneus ventricosus TaxID=182803 RepID=A0A4Y2DQ38_ARAVE|nr:hypothetical protein AVEN_137251-1 [Araneus ventricosus]